MIKSELVLKIAEQNPHLYQRDVENIVNAILDTIADALARGDRVELRGFGAFSVKKRDARTGRNPRTGETVSVEEKVDPGVQDRQGNAPAPQRDDAKTARRGCAAAALGASPTTRSAAIASHRRASIRARSAEALS